MNVCTSNTITLPLSYQADLIEYIHKKMVEANFILSGDKCITKIEENDHLSGSMVLKVVKL